MGQGRRTALRWAASKNSLGVAELLLGAGASVDVKNEVRAGCCCRVAERVVVGQIAEGENHQQMVALLRRQ